MPDSFGQGWLSKTENSCWVSLRGWASLKNYANFVETEFPNESRQRFTQKEMCISEMYEWKKIKYITFLFT